MNALAFLAATALLVYQTQATCNLTQLGGSRTAPILLHGTVLTSKGALQGGTVVIAAPHTSVTDSDALQEARARQPGTILYVGDGCDSQLGDILAAAKPAIVECDSPLDVISPGWINTHEHVAYSTVTPFGGDDGARKEFYSHRHDWRLGLRGHTALEAPVNGSEENAIAWGELRHLFSGTTAMVGGDMAPGLVRNLDFAEGLGKDFVTAGSYESGTTEKNNNYHSNKVAIMDTWDVFPLDDGAGLLRIGDCDYGADPMDGANARKLHRYLAHVAEGIDGEARNEFRCLSDEEFDTTPTALSSGNSEDDKRGGRPGLSTDLLGPNVAMIHALGLKPEDWELVIKKGTKVVWSPRSNAFLYGAALDMMPNLITEKGLPRRGAENGFTVALGTDWLPSGSATMAREAACAFHVTHKQVGPRALWQMMTGNAAEVAGFADRIGRLARGMLGDVVLYSADQSRSPGVEHDEDELYAQAVFAPPENIQLVLRGGKVMLAGGGLEDVAWTQARTGSQGSTYIAGLGGNCEKTAFGLTTQKTICVADELPGWASYLEFAHEMKDYYPAVLPGVPAKEPDCRIIR